jgi:hypothetical protein
MGRRLKALERISVVGELLGLNRSAAYRASRAWPLMGPDTSRYVVTERLLRELGIPYVVEGGDDADGPDE